MWGIEIYSWVLFDGHVSKLTWEELLMGYKEDLMRFQGDLMVT